MTHRNSRLPTRALAFKLSLLHPVLSAALLLISYVLSDSGAIGYATALGFFIINLPGVILTGMFYTSGPQHNDMYPILFVCVLLTWALVALPCSFLACHIRNWMKKPRAL